MGSNDPFGRPGLGVELPGFDSYRNRERTIEFGSSQPLRRNILFYTIYYYELTLVSHG